MSATNTPGELLTVDFSLELAREEGATLVFPDDLGVPRFKAVY